MYDVVLKNGILVTSYGQLKVDIGIKDGKVVTWGTERVDECRTKIIDCTNRLILPGFVDMHFHCRVPGRDSREDFDTATMAASRGGATTIIEMPIADPSPNNEKNFNNRVEYARSRAVVDFGFYGAGATLSSEAAQILAECGAIGFKLFLHEKPVGRDREFQNLCVTNTCDLYKSIKTNKSTGLITAIHCEDDGLIRAISEEYEGDKNSYRAQIDCRRPEAEELAVLTAGMIAKSTGGRIHICHVSTLNAINAIKYLKQQNIDISAETCPHYLLLDEDLMRQYGTYTKVNPPLKNTEHRKALYEALKNDTLKAVASDHSPFLPREKENKDLNFLSAPSGMPSIEFFGAMMIDEAIKGKWSLSELVKWMSENPARLLGIYPKKGSLSIGSDADFLLVDPNLNYKVDVEKLFTKSRYSCYPFEAREFKGKIVSTYVRGKKVYSEDNLYVNRGYGEFIYGPKFKG